MGCSSFSALPLLLAAALASRGASAANILCLLSTPTPSHHIWSAPLVRGLATRGHNVTVLSPTAMKPPVPNVSDLVIEGAVYVPEDDFDYEAHHRLSDYEWLVETFNWYLDSCKYALGTKGVRQLNEYPDDFKFDLIIIEATGGECLLGFVEKFGRPPVLAVNGFGNPQWLNWNMGNPDHPAYVTNFHLTLHWPFSLWDKARNVLLHCATLYRYYSIYLPQSDALLKEHFAGAPWVSRVPPAAEILSNVSVVLVNAHYSVDGARPMVPAVVPVAGIHIQPPKPLPQDLQRWLDGASDGAVLFSLGTLVRSSTLGARQLREIVAAFAALPRVRFLWKWEAEEPPGQLPSNVRVAKWLPQGDILAHPRLRAFVSHAGMLSSHEALWHGVPLVALPFIADQRLNARRLEALGVAERLDYASLTRERLVAALDRVLHDQAYRRRMQQVSSVFRSRPTPPLTEALFWTEHVLQHGGAPRNRCAAADLAWYELWLLDVAAVFFAAFLAVCVSVALVVRMLRRRVFSRGKAKEE